MALADVAIVVTSISGTAVAGTALLKWGPVAWVFDRLVKQPITEWHQESTERVLQPLRAENARDHAYVRSELTGLSGKVEGLSDEVNAISARLDDTTEALEEELGLEV